MVYGELGRKTLKIKIFKRMIGFWLKILLSKESKLSNILYRLTRVLHDSENENEMKSAWLTKIKSILDNCGLSNVWVRPEQFDSEWILKSVEQRLSDIELQEWYGEVERNSLCTNYKLFKTEFKQESYLTKVDIGERIALTRYRCGSHRLPVAKERYLPLTDPHICPLCDKCISGDEFHYALVCTAVQEERTKFLKGYFCRNPSVLKFRQLFDMQGPRSLIKLGKFVKHLMSVFQN